MTGRNNVLLILALGLGAACAPLRAERTFDSTPAVVVVGCGADEASARTAAEHQLRLRIQAELERRAALGAPAARVRDWKAVGRALDATVPGLAHGETAVVGGDAVVSLRLSAAAFEEAVTRIEESGRRVPLRVACVPLEVRGDERRLFELRELYGAALRDALEAGGIEAIPTDALYAALDRAKIAAIDEAGARALGREAHAQAVVSGAVRAEGGTVHLDVVVRDAVSGRALGGFDGAVGDDAGVLAIARRQAVVLRMGLGER